MASESATNLADNGQHVNAIASDLKDKLVLQNGRDRKSYGSFASAEGGSGENVGNFEGRAEAGKLETKFDGPVGEVERSGKIVGKVEGARKEAGNVEDSWKNISDIQGPRQIVGKVVAENIIVMATKSMQEAQYVESLAGGEVQRLKLPEGAILVAAHKGVQDTEGFQVQSFLKNLNTFQFGRTLLYAHRLPSTHTLLSQNFQLFPRGTVCIADIQYQGKGRAGNVWESPMGCLMFSFTLQMGDGRAVPFLQYVVSLAIIEGIEAVCSTKGVAAPEVKIKWPNDLYVKGLKIGGVLCTSSYSAKKFNIVIGVGLNVGNREPTTCLDALLHELNDHAPSLSRDELLAAYFGRFEELFNVFSSQGFSALEGNYYERWLHSGQTVVLEERKEGTSEVSKVSVKIQGLTATGYLKAIDEATETYELHPDGNSFDFLRGLVRQKI